MEGLLIPCGMFFMHIVRFGMVWKCIQSPHPNPNPDKKLSGGSDDGPLTPLCSVRFFSARLNPLEFFAPPSSSCFLISVPAQNTLVFGTVFGEISWREEGF